MKIPSRTHLFLITAIPQSALHRLSSGLLPASCKAGYKERGMQNNLQAVLQIQEAHQTV